MKMKNNIELLAPAGNIEKMKTALAFGADAVYAGIPDFSLRVRINNFDVEKIGEATEYCHKQKKKIYITLNIFAHNKHFENLPGYIKKLKKIGVDGLIVSDPGVIEAVKKNWPEAHIHLSTQANCTNWLSAKFWHDQGVERIILGREVTLKEIKEIHKKVPGVELEYFVHGAMCMTYSGRCFLSKYFVDRSANLGDCVQPCRWKYKVSQKNDNEELGTNRSSTEKICKLEGEDSFFISEEKRPDNKLEVVEEEHGSYILNSKDLCLIKHLKDLKEAGIVSFKIEGRAKSIYYQAIVNGIYSKAIKNINTITSRELNNLYIELEKKITNRGYTDGFLLGGKSDQEINKSHTVCDWEFCGEIIGESRIINKKSKILKYATEMRVHNVVKSNDTIEIVIPYYEVKKVKLKKMYDIMNNKVIFEAHGGQNKTVLIETGFKIPKYSVIRRLINKQKK